MEDIKQLLTVLFFLALTLSQDLDEFDDPNSAMFKSNTKCNFSTGTIPAINCEHSVFGVFPFTGNPLTSPLVTTVEDGDFGCEQYTTKDQFEAKIVVLSRGVCSFYTKALNAQKAGASALVVYDTEEDVRPVRVKGTGDETEIVKIPVIMISREDGEILRTLPSSDEKATITMDIDISSKYEDDGSMHPLTEEYLAKSEVVLSDFQNAEKLMQLGASFSRNGWPETARVFLRVASAVVKSDADYDVAFGVGEYFHNQEEKVDEGQIYFRQAGDMIVDFLKDKTNPKKEKKLARERLVSIMSLIPDGPTQKALGEKLWEGEMFKEVSERNQRALIKD
tara:strand:+ start:373 stop:1380 length:1008 start_codon:yes stop_codon:yes gene_type:complete